MISGSDSESDAPPLDESDVRSGERGLSRFPEVCEVDYAEKAADELVEK